MLSIGIGALGSAICAGFVKVRGYAMDFALARLNMVESQVRPSSVTDRGVIGAMSEIPREHFVPKSLKTLAYMDGDLALPPEAGADRRFLLAPRSLARLIQLATVEPDDSVLDVGCATGYSTAMLARLAQTVVGVECNPGMAHGAAETLRGLGVLNAIVVEGPLHAGRKDRGPYDAIVLNGAVPKPPSALLDQLKERGRLVAIVTDPSGASSAHLYVRHGLRVSDSREFDVGALWLPGFERARAFVL